MSTADASRPPTNVLIAAGGTGGHLFPARALAEELGRRGVVVDLATDMRGQVYDHGFPARAFHLVPAATPVGRSAARAVRAAVTLFRGVRVARGVLKRVKPSAVVGFGGYPTVPPIVAARLAGVPTLLHEQNAVMGRANRLLARLATGIAMAVPRPAKASASMLARSVVTGNPVRDAVVDASRIAVPKFTGAEWFHLLVFGGSQGAHVFAEVVPLALAGLPPGRRARLRVVQQCRIEDLDAVRAAYDAIGVDAELAPFFTDLPQRIAAAHLVVARSGASTVAEIAAIGRPAIFVPLPHAIDNDQLYNARALAAAGGAWVIEQRDLDAARLARDIGALIDAPAELSRAAAAARSAGRPHAVTTLADLVLHLAAGGRVQAFRAGREGQEAS